jgi:phosphoribosylamine--glycine ligase
MPLTWECERLPGGNRAAICPGRPTSGRTAISWPARAQPGTGVAARGPAIAGGWRWAALAFTTAGAGLLPWMFYLAVSLPGTPRVFHWPLAWVGLDAMEAAGLLTTGILLLRRDLRYCLTALPTAGLLVTDAWFDVTTAPPGSSELISVAMAVAAELPAAAACVLIALAGLRRLAASTNGGWHAPGPPPSAALPRRARAAGHVTGPFTWPIAPSAGSDAGRRPAGRLWAVRVLVLGSGGREHALTRSLASDPAVTQLHAGPGNPGIAELAETHPVTVTDPAEVTGLAVKVAADLVVVGPEAPLVAGVADAVRAAGVSCFGPGRGAAMIEGSKSFAKDVMIAAGVPTARARTCRAAADVEAALDEFGPPYVVKADGLAAGKGVVVTSDRDAAAAHARSCGTVVVEEFLDGPEVSVFALTDGVTAIALLPAQDYKRAGDGDHGPNTGGMGAYAPLPWAQADLAAQTLQTVVNPALAELRRRDTPFSGLLYSGLCLTSRGFRVVEFNARFGDPEAQVVLDRLATPLSGLLKAAADGDLAAAPGLEWRDGATVTVVIAAEGYPAAPVKGDLIEGLAEASHVQGAYVLQAGTAAGPDGTLISAGGRVLNVVGTGPDLAQARSTAYQAAAEIRMRGGWCRRDIAANPAGGTLAGL